MAAVSCRNSSSLRLASHLSPPTPPSTSSLMAPVRLGRGHRARRERGVGLGREPCYGTPRLPRSPLQRIIALPGGAAPRAAPARPRRRGPRSGAASFILAFLSHFPTDSGRNMAAGATWSDRASAAGSARLGDSGGKRGPWRRRRPSVRRGRVYHVSALFSVQPPVLSIPLLLLQAIAGAGRGHCRLRSSPLLQLPPLRRRESARGRRKVHLRLYCPRSIPSLLRPMNRVLFQIGHSSQMYHLDSFHRLRNRISACIS
jgi:hypothetical protein